MKRWAELIAAFTLLTRVPVSKLSATHPPVSACAWAYPIVGAGVGAVGALVLVTAMRLGMPQPLAAVWAVAAITLVTGALHEDGLADTADGFGGGRTIERKLLIMRDSRIGSYGAMALGFSLLARTAAIALSPRPATALVLSAILARGAILAPALLLRPARPDGLAASLAAGSRAPMLAGLAIAAVTAIATPAAAIAALASGLVVTALAWRQIGGYTGDVLGATEQLAECAALAAL